MDTLALLAALTVMGAVVFGLLAIYGATAAPRSHLERRLGTIMGEAGGFDVLASDHEALRQRRQGLPILGSLLQGKSWADEVAGRLERADIRLTVSEFVGLRFFAGFFGAALPLLLLGGGIIVMVAIFGGAIAGYMLPSIWVTFAQGRRISKLNEQLVDALSMLSNSLKAGFGLMQSMDLASRELQHPIATEFRRTLHDINVGSSTDDALAAMAKRCGSNDLEIVITAMLIQQSTGGNLSEILDNVAHTMRERIRIRGEIKTLTTQQLMTGIIIGALPIFIGVFVSMSNPGYLQPLFHTVAGNVALGGAAMLETFGIFLIKRILDIEV